LFLTCGEENENNSDDDYPEPKVVAPARGVAGRGAAVFAGVAKRSVVAASHISYLLSVAILCLIPVSG